jgi:hypothetical protein
MDRFTQNKLNINPRSDVELRGVLTSFERKWQNKARRHLGGDELIQL